MRPGLWSHSPGTRQLLSTTPGELSSFSDCFACEIRCMLLHTGSLSSGVGQQAACVRKGKAFDGVSPPGQGTDGVLRKVWKPMRGTEEARQALVKSHLIPLRISSLCLSVFFSSLLPSQTMVFLYHIPVVGLHSILGHKLLLFLPFPSSLTLICSAFASPCCSREKGSGPRVSDR